MATVSKLFKIKITEKNSRLITKLQEAMPSILARAVGQESRLMSIRVKQSHFSGPTSSKSVSRKTSKLFRSVIPIEPSISGDSARGGISMGGGVIYSSVHIGPVGQRTLITPKKGSALAIPLNHRAEFLQRRVASLYDIKSLKRRGDLLGTQRAGVFTPYFLLKRSVSIPSRVHPEIIAYENVMPVMMGIRKYVFNRIEAIGR